MPWLWAPVLQKDTGLCGVCLQPWITAHSSQIPARLLLFYAKQQRPQCVGNIFQLPILFLFTHAEFSGNWSLFGAFFVLCGIKSQCVVWAPLPTGVMLRCTQNSRNTLINHPQRKIKGNELELTVLIHFSISCSAAELTLSSGRACPISFRPLIPNSTSTAFLWIQWKLLNYRGCIYLCSCLGRQLAHSRPEAGGKPVGRQHGWLGVWAKQD